MSAVTEWTVSLLSKRHERERFDCGEPALNAFIRQFARQNQEQNVGRTWVATTTDDTAVLGFYTLTVATISHDLMAPEDTKRLPRYPIPVAHLGRLAVDGRSKGQKLGEYLLLHALEQVYRVSQVVGIFGAEVRAKHAEARRFYEHFGFRPVKDDPNHLYLSLKKIELLFD